ncbi:MAG: hypothetical protein N2053_08910 [Chitinispirillaceae bacterium]|nr:hypothetical protein [Chitinispirillaceae bacterium]
MMKIGFLEVLIIILVVGAPITGVLFLIYSLFCFAQEKIFLASSDYLLIPNVFLGWSFVIFGLAFFMLIVFKIDFDGYAGKIIYMYQKISAKLVGIVALAVFFIVIFFNFFSYTIVAPGGIVYKESLFQNEVHYSWNDVKRADIFYSIHQKKHRTRYRLHYTLSTADDKQFDMKLSKQFWDKVISVDNLLKEKNIKVNRGEIQRYSCFSLLIDESVEFSEGLRIIEQIMAVEE